MKFHVLRPHVGDRPYSVGETREAAPIEVAHLTPHVLRPGVAEKARQPVANKARGDAPRNK